VFLAKWRFLLVRWPFSGEGLPLELGAGCREPLNTGSPVSEKTSSRQLVNRGVTPSPPRRRTLGYYSFRV
jgi:hypothetical protein